MLAPCLISLFAISSGCAMRKTSNFHDMELNKMIGSSHTNNTFLHHDTFHTSTDNSTKMYYETFVPFLLNISMGLLQNARNNIKRNYDLSPNEIEAIDDAFGTTKYEYQLILKNNLENMTKNIKYKNPEIFLLDFTDFSNYLLQTILQTNLDKVKGQLLLPSKWYKHLLKYTILRQQTKILINVIEVKICYTFSICVTKAEYSEYLVEWLRLLMNAKDAQLKEFFSLIPPLLNKYMHTIKTNIKFRQQVKKFVETDSNYQRSVIDFLDEIITEQEIAKAVQHKLRKYVVTLKDLFVTIDLNYELNAINEKKMDDLNKQFWLWTEGENIEIREVLQKIMENMFQNVQIWPTEAQVKLANIWYKVVLL